MPALPSSSIDPVLGHLAGLADDAGQDPPGLLAVLARVADPRHRRGVRHKLAVILGLAVCAVLARARSFTAIAEWAADAGQETLARLGVAGPVPSESTFRRTLQRLDVDAFRSGAGNRNCIVTSSDSQAAIGLTMNEIRRLRAILSRPARPVGHQLHWSMPP